MAAVPGTWTTIFGRPTEQDLERTAPPAFEKDEGGKAIIGRLLADSCHVTTECGTPHLAAGLFGPTMGATWKQFSCINAIHSTAVDGFRAGQRRMSERYIRSSWTRAIPDISISPYPAAGHESVDGRKTLCRS
jgi:hypothetical protein